MRVRVEATVKELEERCDDLVRALADRFSDFDPGLAEMLEKALPHKEQELKYPVLRELKRRTTVEYEAQLKKMLGAISDVLDGKSELRKAFGDPPEKPEPGEEPEEELEPGDYDPKTDEMVPEPELEEEEEEEEEKSLAKAEQEPQVRVGQAALYVPESEPVDHTKAIADADGRAYERVKAQLMRHGYRPKDYEKGGKLYGQSVNQLIELLREKSDG